MSLSDVSPAPVDTPSAQPDMAPLTEGQAGLWFAQRVAPDNPSFNTGHVSWIEGPLDLAAFTSAAEQAAHEAHSLSLALRDGPKGPLQWRDPARSPRLERIDLSHHADPRTEARALIERDLQTPTDPQKGSLARQCLYLLGPKKFAWFQRAHHLTNDGYGMALWGTRLGELYAGLVAQAASHEPLAPLQSVLDEDAAYQHSERRAKDAAFWREAFADMPEVVGLASGRAVAAHTCHRLAVPLSRELRTQLLAYAQSLKLPWPDVLTAITALYVLRMSGAAQTVVGVPYMGRLGSASARATATVMNVLPLRVTAHDDMPLADFIHGIARDQLRARRHGRYRSEQLRRDLGLLGGQRRLHGPLINVQPFYRALELPGVQLALEILSTGPIDDITIGFRGDGTQHLDLEIEANPDLYSVATTQAHQDRLLAFLASALHAQTLGEMALASPAESQRYLFDVNATDHPVPDTTLTALIEARMAQTPQAIALEYEGETLSYGELDARTRSLASALQARGAWHHQLVAVALPRSLELLVGLVAVLRAGAAYLPLDLSHPPERLARILALAQPVCVLVRDEDAAVLPADAARFAPRHWPTPSMDALLAIGLRPQDAAYVIYTSGSTGEPKGVLVEHRAIVNRLEWMRQHYGFDASDRILQKTPATFDVSVWEFFLPLITGCTLVIAPPEAHRDPVWLARLMRQRAIGTCHFVPSMLAAFLGTPGARGLRMRRIFCSGEELSAPLRDQLHATLHSELHNLYGPTEAAVDVSYWPADAQDHTSPVPIGFPVWNTRLYVLDARMRALPPGVSGDLYLGGVQLARGYLGRDDLSAERFLPDPHRPGERLYKTGDLARWREDGAVVFLGRSDHQIKLRGLRIELGDIEAAMAASGLVERSAVVVREDQPGDKRLIAYVQAGTDFNEKALRAQVAAQVPDYMVPAAFVALDDWPVTANGKLDRGCLPAPRIEAAQGEAPRTDTETALAQLFLQVLELPADMALSVEADFFSLGGDSLSAVALLALIQNRWRRDPGLGTLFATPTLGALAASIDSEEVRFDSGLAPTLQLVAGDPVLPMLFVVHPAGGIVWGYRHLARALADAGAGRKRSVYGLQSPALDPDAPLPHSIDELAQQYVQRILDLQPRGPIHLLGWSVGGIIAQAMAVELRARQRDVGVVALLDAYPADVWRSEPEPTPLQALRALLAIAGHDPEGHPELTTREAVIDFLRQGDTALGHLPVRALEGVVRVVTDTNRLIRQHHHRRFDGTLTHVRAANDHASKPQLQAERWVPYAADVDTLALPLLHAEMTGEHATRLMAPLLQQLIGSAD
ncbi:amino acid adenylation domain-containing protein [Hydrogenophaga sp.]|uniref:amino acid adenylation domain-containing protein n=1 Tax=Hydrogenophaga sp. TaxID=1904254 RepID=UPI00271696D1|nr:amino acid adenylation domain-containing protein [Hydrogenophaga sp.]MDO9436920.1 amino acid adenylation domain-containing protein [Hydrogenophaga sp.]